MKRPCISWALAAGLLFAGCAGAPWDDGPGADRPARQPAERKEYPGVVESVRDVEVDSTRTGVAPMVGAVIGGTAGGSVGRGRGSTAGVVVGTVIGGIAGEAAAQAGTQPGLEITVRLDNGRVIAVTQPADKETFTPGDRVRVQTDGKTARVVR